MDFTKQTKNFPIYVAALQIAAFWGVWQWLGGRIFASGEETWALLALVFAGLFCFLNSNKVAAADKTIGSRTLFLAGIFLVLYAASFSFTAPPLVRAVLAMISLTFTLSDWRFGKIFHFGIFALLLLGLPVMASLNFFAGFPLRVIVGEAVEFLLKMQGLNVVREGVCLHFGEKLIWIDAPCSGIKMLWFGMFLAAISICFYELKNAKSLFVLGLSFAAILLGNIFRAAALFYTEAEIIKTPAWMHEAVGVVSFAATALAIVFIVKSAADFKWQKYFSS